MLNKPLIAELKNEARKTRKLLERVPVDKHDFKPHEKSTQLQRLASHIAELPEWTVFTLKQDELNFQNGYKAPTPYNSAQELVAEFDKHVKAAEDALNEATDAEFEKPWSLKSGDHVIFTLPKADVLREFVFNHMIHHRAQLGVYMRLLDIPLPGMYGPSADEEF